MRTLSTSFQIGIVSFFIILAVGFSFYTLNFEKNITGFYKLGDVLPLSPYLEKDKVLVNTKQVGYDGQFFLTLGLDPFLSHTDTAKSLDYPKYRVGRILLPLSAYIFSFGNRDIIPYTLVFLNAALILGAVILLSKKFHLDKINRWYALLFLCIPGLWIIFGFSTSEIMGGFFVVAGLYAQRLRKFAISAGLLSAACLAKEVTILFWGACLLECIISKNKKAAAFFLIFIIPFVLFRLFLIQHFGNSSSELLNFGIPLAGHKAVISSWFSGGHINKNEYFYFPLLCVSTLFLLYKSKENWNKQKAIFFSSLGYLFLFFMSSTAILDYHISYNRVYFMIYLLLILSIGKPLSKVDKVFWGITGLSALRFVYWYSR